MGRTLHYRPGSWYVTDDRTGLPQRRERVKKQWNGIIVDESVWEPRQPQDLVKGVPDYQSVPDARPLAPNRFISALYFEMSQTAMVATWTIYLDTQGGIGIGDEVGVVLDADNGAIFRTRIVFIGNGYVEIATPIPGQASSGNLLVDYRPGSGVGYPNPLMDMMGDPLRDSDGNVIYEAF